MKQSSKSLFIGFFILLVVGYILLSSSSENATVKSEEEKLAAVLGRIEGVGQVVVYLQGASSPSFFQSATPLSYNGVLIVADGADDIAVRQKLQKAIGQVLHIPAHRIVILPMKEEKEQ